MRYLIYTSSMLETYNIMAYIREILRRRRTWPQRNSTGASLYDLIRWRCHKLSPKWSFPYRHSQRSKESDDMTTLL